MLASLAIQSALYTTLATDSTLLTLGSGVYDALPADMPFPYVVIGQDTETPWNGLTKIGRAITVTIHIFSRQNGMKEAKQIADRIITLIERQTLTANGITTVSSVLDLSQFFMDPDGLTRHGVVRFRFLAQ
jgi:hypothetical protein